MKASGDVTDYNSNVTDAIAGAFAVAASVDPSSVVVAVSAASVLISVRILAATPAAATLVQDALMANVSTPSAATALLSAIGGGVAISIEEIAQPPTLLSEEQEQEEVAPQALRPEIVVLIAVAAAVQVALACLVLRRVQSNGCATASRAGPPSISRQESKTGAPAGSHADKKGLEEMSYAL